MVEVELPASATTRASCGRDNNKQIPPSIQETANKFGPGRIIVFNSHPTNFASPMVINNDIDHCIVMQTSLVEKIVETTQGNAVVASGKSCDVSYQMEWKRFKKWVDQQ